MIRLHLFLATLALLFLPYQATPLPQNPNAPDPCLLFLQDLTNPNIPIESRSIEVNNTLDYSGHNLNDLGNYKKCNNKTSQAFSLVSLSVSGMSSMMGFCAPSYCSTEQLQQYSDYAIQFITNITGKDVSKLVQTAFIDPTQTGINKGFWLYFSIILFSGLCALVIVGTISANIKRIPKREKSQVDSHNGDALKEALLVNPFS